MTSPIRERWRPRLPLLAYLAVCYLPLVVQERGWVSADTKTYLYLDPGRLMSRAWSMWDPDVGLGTVSHQTIGYLWPMGPWYWLMDALSVPDWLAQRLWWGTLLALAGIGAAQLVRRMGWPATAAWPAAFLYGLTPYVLTHVGRLSGVLLPYVGLPWLILLAMAAVRSRGWRHPALFALVVTSVGSVNLTSLVLVVLGPLLWMAWTAVAERTPLREVVVAGARIAALTVPVCLWWAAGLAVQASHGLDIVRYTETAEVVASTSTASEVLRGLGYWFFYGGDQLELWVASSEPYTQRLWLLALTFALPALALLAAGVTRARHRSFAVGLVALGVVVAVGAHGWQDAPPLGSLIRAGLGTERGLAFRSLPRATPLVALGLAILTGGLVHALGRHRARLGRALQIGTCVAAVLALLPLWDGALISESLRRRGVPDYWLEAAEAIDEGDRSTRVLELPGTDFADYRWGSTVDPITPGLIDRPYVAREHVPFGGAASADLLNALDLALQERRLTAEAIAPIARLLRVGDIVLRNDLQVERYNIARPRLVWALIQDAAGLGAAQGFGPPAVEDPHVRRQLHDAAHFERALGLEDPASVVVVPVEDPATIVATKPVAAPLVVAGDGTGLVDAAMAGLLDGHELVRYSAALTDAALRDELEAGARLLLTDTNRRRGNRWSTVRHTQGFTEPEGHEPLVHDPTDNRLPVFPDAPAGAATVAEHRGGITARASTYGNPIALAGELRATNAIDGDPATAWATGAFVDARGERLRIELDEPVETDRIRLLQPDEALSNRWLTEVDIRIDDGPPQRVVLDESSRAAPGQLVEIPRTALRSVDIEVVADSAGDRPRYGPFGPVGFAEVSIGDGAAPTVDEVIRLPRDLLGRAGAAASDLPLAVLLTRIRQDPTDITRGDEEPRMARAVELPHRRELTVVGTARLSGRAAPALVDELLGQSVAGLRVDATSTLTGSLRHRPSAALDGDPRTWWATEVDATAGEALLVTLPGPTDLGQLELVLVADGAHSVPTELALTVDGGSATRIPVPPADAAVDGRITVPVDLRGVIGTEVRLEIAQVDPVTSVGWDSGAPEAHPVGLAELGLDAARLPAPAPQVDTGCRTDLLEVDGRPVPVRISGDTEAALRGGGLRVTGCQPVVLEAGDHDVRTRPGTATGLDLDQLVLDDGLIGAPAAHAAPVRVLEEGRAHLRVEVPAGGASEPTWLVLGQSLNAGWTATVDGRSLGAPELVDGYANGWRLPTTDEALVIDLRFAPQQRVNLALAVSAAAAALCLVLAVRGRPAPAREPDGPALDAPVTAGGPAPWPRAAGAGIAAGALAALVLPVPAALACALLAVGAARWRPAAWALALAPAVLGALTLAYVVGMQARDKVLPGLEWPIELERSHWPAMAAVVLLVVGLVVAAARRDAS